MEKLSLDDNELSEDIPAELGKLFKLTLLWLSENNLSGKIPVDLGGLSNLKWLGISENQLSGCVPDSLEDQLNRGSSSAGSGRQRWRI